MLIIKEVQLYFVNKNLFSSNNISLYNPCHHVVFSLQAFPADITLQPIPGLTSVVL